MEARANHRGWMLLLSAIFLSMAFASPIGNGLLLPATPAVQYKLESSFGCFDSWTSTLPHILEVVTIKEAGKNCASSAIVSVRGDTTINQRQALSVFASNVGTDESEQWRVFVDRIERIQILTTFRDFFMDDVGIFKVQAFDSQGNHFSTLEGIAFDWTVVAVQPKGTAALKKVALSELHDTTERITQDMLSMELKQQQPHMSAFHAQMTGKVTVSCRIVQTPFQDVAPTEVDVHVTEALQLRPAQPAPLVVAPFATFQFTLLAWRGRRQALEAGSTKPRDRMGKLHIFKMPSTQYKWRSEDMTVLPITTATGRVVAGQLGQSIVHVEDLNLEMNKQSAVVMVADPHKLRLYLGRLESVESRWSDLRRADRGGASTIQLLRGGWPTDGPARMLQVHQYELSAFMFAESGLEMLVTENTKISFEVDPTFLEATELVPGSVLLRGKQRGITKVCATLERIVPPECVAGRSWGEECPWFSLIGEAKQAAQKKIVACLEILVDDPVAVVPACPLRFPAVVGVSHTLLLKGSGGSSAYKWQLMEHKQPNMHSVVSLSPGGLITSSGSASVPGGDSLTITDASVSFNHATCSVLSSAPVQLEVVVSPPELPVGGVMLLELRLRDSQGHLFNNCSAVAVRYGLSDSSILSNSSSEQLPRALSPGVCAYQLLHAEQAGKVQVDARFLNLQGSATVSVFRPLDIIVPRSRQLLVALGSSAFIEFGGGPFGGLGTVSAEDENAVQLVQQTDDIGHFVWKASCLRLGTQRLTVRITHSEKRATVFEETIEWECAVPAALAVVPGYEACLPETQPAAAATRHVLSFSSVPVRLLAFNAESRQFDGTDSIVAQWTAQHTGGRTGPILLDPPLQLLDDCSSQHRTAKVGNDGETVIVYIKASQVKLLNSNKVDLGGAAILTTTLNANLELVPTAHPSLVPEDLLALCDPSNVVVMKVLGGSGSMQLSLSPPEVASYSTDYSTWEVQLVPKVCNKQVVVTVTDSLLYGSHPVSATVSFSDIERIEIETSPQLELGTTAPASLSVYGMDGGKFDGSQLKQMQVRWESLDARRLTLTEPGSAESLITVHALESGNVYVHATVQTVEAGPVSAKQQIRIFPKLELLPPHLHLLLGNSFQLQASGGMRSGVPPTFDSSNETAALVSEAPGTEGVVNAGSVGVTTVTLTEHSSGSKRIAEATSTVEVISLSEFRIAMQSSKLQLGNEMSVYVEGPDHESPFMFSFGNADNFRWEISDPSVLSLLSASGKDTPKSSGSFGVRLRGLSAGRAEVRVHIEWLKPCCSKEYDCLTADSTCQPMTVSYTTSATVVVSEGLALEMPAVLTLPPNTKFAIKTNADESQLLFKVVGTEDILNVDSMGMITTRDTLGSCHVLVQSAAGDQSLVVTVHVRQLHQLMITPPAISTVSTSEASSKSVLLPVGSSMLLSLCIADEVGNCFTSIGSIPVSYLRDRTDVLKVERIKNKPLQLRVTAKSPGVTSMRVWLNVGGVSAAAVLLDDFVRISVGNIIGPTAASVLVGGSIAFSLSPGFRNTSAAESAVWSVVNNDIATIDGLTGVATTGAAGSTMVHVSTESMQSHSLLNVVRLSAAGASVTTPARQPDLSDHDQGRLFKFLVSVNDAAGMALSPSGSAGTRHMMKLQCVASGGAAKWVRLSPSTDSTGQLACGLSVLQLPEDTAPQLDLTLSMTVSDALGSDTVSLMHQTAILQGLRLWRAGSKMPQHELTMSGPSEVITVHGLCPADGLQVQAASSSLKVGTVDTSSTGDMHTFTITRAPAVKLLYRGGAVTIECAATGEKIRLKVGLLDESGGTIDHAWYHLQAWQSENQPALVLLLTVLAIFVGLWFLSGGGAATAAPSPGHGLLSPTVGVVPAATHHPSATPKRLSPPRNSLLRPTPTSFHHTSQSPMPSPHLTPGSGQRWQGVNESPLRSVFGN